MKKATLTIFSKNAQKPPNPRIRSFFIILINDLLKCSKVLWQNRGTGSFQKQDT